MNRWLEREVSGREAFFLVFTIVFLKFLYAYLIVFALQNLPVDLSGVSANTVQIKAEEITLLVFLSMFAMVAFEEFAFRAVPLAIAIERDFLLPEILLVGVVSSVLFGWIHGNAYNILIQGIGGFFYCIIFLKCGGLKGRFIKAFSWSVLAHFSFNTINLGFVYFF